MNARSGTDVDAAIAMKTFSQLGYKVKVANDQTVDKMHKLISSGNEKINSSFLFHCGSAVMCVETQKRHQRCLRVCLSLCARLFVAQCPRKTTAAAPPLCACCSVTETRGWCTGPMAQNSLTASPSILKATTARAWWGNPNSSSYRSVGFLNSRVATLQNGPGLQATF